MNKNTSSDVRTSEALDAEITALRDAIAERNLFSNSETEELEALIAKSMVLGELYWQEAQAQAVPEWIPVESQMPPTDKTVLVCWDYAPDIEPDKEYITIDENLDEYWPNCQDEPPTHWMPLPQPPKAQDQSHD